MKKITKNSKLLHVAGAAASKQTMLHESAVKFSILGNAINGTLDLINQIVFYFKNPKAFRLIYNNFKDNSPQMYAKLDRYPSKSYISMGSPFI